MHQLTLRKPDGRELTLYSRQPIPANLSAPSPRSDPVIANPHLRWHPLRREWVAYADHRQTRTFLPPPEFDPLMPSDDPAHPTELPVGSYDVAVFDNLFPALSLQANARPESIVPTAPGNGHCEVVVYSQNQTSSLARLALSHIELLLEVWADRTRRITANAQIRFVLPFENRGEAVGVTLHHPHGQIYAYPFVPPVPAGMHVAEIEHFSHTQQCLLESLIKLELAEGTRVLYAGEHAVAFVPAWARYPYEVWVATRSAVPDFTQLSSEQRADLARALKITVLKYDGLFDQTMPYVMAWYQAPSDGSARGPYHLHAEFYPSYRMKGRIKYLAGTELAAGMFASDALPEVKARELQSVKIATEAL